MGLMPNYEAFVVGGLVRWLGRAHREAQGVGGAQRLMVLKTAHVFIHLVLCGYAFWSEEKHLPKADGAVDFFTRAAFLPLVLRLGERVWMDAQRVGVDRNAFAIAGGAFDVFVDPALIGGAIQHVASAIRQADLHAQTLAHVGAEARAQAYLN